MAPSMRCPNTDHDRPGRQYPCPMQARLADAPSPGLSLLLFTESFPYSVAREGTFLAPQLPHLRAAFKRVIIVPSRRGGARAVIPDGIEVDEGLADKAGGRNERLRIGLLALRSRLLWQELVGEPSLALNRAALKRLIRTTGKAQAVRQWLTSARSDLGINTSDWVAYSFWCDHTALGLASSKALAPRMSIAARVNGHDLFRERHEPPYIPCQEENRSRSRLAVCCIWRRDGVRSCSLLLAATVHQHQPFGG